MICRDLHDAAGLEDCLLNLAMLEIHQGEFDSAVHRLEEVEASGQGLRAAGRAGPCDVHARRVFLQPRSARGRKPARANRSRPR